MWVCTGVCLVQNGMCVCHPAGWYVCVSFSCLSVSPWLQYPCVSVLLLSEHIMSESNVTGVAAVGLCVRTWDTHICLNEGVAWLSDLQPSEQARPTSEPMSSAAESGHRSQPRGHTSTHCCVESPENTSQSSSFVQGCGLATPLATSTCVLCTVGPDGAQLHPGLGSDVVWAMRPGPGFPEPLCIVCVCACACVPPREESGRLP